jgi:lipopolysaccharide export system permease protein
MLRELIGPFVFGVALFTMLGMSITYLFAFTDFAVRGVPIGLLAELSMLYLPGMLSKTLPAAMLLACLLATGRMSGDSEMTALFAVGVDLKRAIRAVGWAGLAVSAFAILLTEYVVPPAASRAGRLKVQAAGMLEQSPLHPVSIPVHTGDALEYMVVTRDADFAQKMLWGVTVVHYPLPGAPSTALEGRRRVSPDWCAFAPTATYRSGVIRLERGTVFVVKTGERGAFAELPISPQNSQTKLAALFRFLEGQQANKDPDSTSLEETLQKIRDMKATGLEKPDAIRNLEMGFYNKIAFPLATLIFALVGAPLGIRQSRTSNALGFALALVIIFGYWMLSSYMAVLGQGGAIAPWLASFGPNFVGLVFAAGLLIRRSR